MALSPLIQWEVRPTTGAADNGGGFKAGAAGIDRSQQAGPQVVIDNIAITCTTPAANSNTLTFTAGYTPAAVDVGNVVAITGGVNINTGLYEITAQNGLAPPNGTWTVTGATNLTTAGGAGSAITGNMGGARGGGSAGFSNGTTTLQSRLIGGQKVWVLKEAWNEAVNLTVAGGAGTPIVIEGYLATRGDTPTGADRPKNNRAAAAGPVFTVGASGYVLKNLIAQNAGSSGFSSTTFSVQYVNCRSTTNGTDGWTGTTGVLNLLGCEADVNSGVGVNVTGLSPIVGLEGCALHNNTLGGFLCVNTSQMMFTFDLFYANAATGIAFNSSNVSGHFTNLLIDGNTGAASDGIFISSPINREVWTNCIFSNNGRYGANATLGNATYIDYCDYFQNATAPRNNGIPVGPHDLAVDPQFTFAAAGDFSIGTNLKALGFPGIFPTGTSTGFLDIGAVQRQEPAGGGGGNCVFIPAGFFDR